MQKEEQSSYLGLSKSEALSAYKKYGPNEIRDINPASIPKILLRQISKNYVIYFLLLATIISFFVGKELTGYTILLVIAIVIVVGFVQEYKAEKAISALKKMIVPTSIAIRDGKEKEINSTHLVPGDIIILRNGEKIPADCIVLEEKDLLVNESIITGESREVKKTQVKSEENYKDENIILMGSFIVSGRCIAKVLHSGMNTRFGKIAGLVSTTEKEMPLQNKVNLIAKYMVIMGLSIALLTGAVFLLRSESLSSETIISALILVIAISVASFPEGLPVTLITALSTGAYRMARKNAVVSRMSIIETLGETTVICSDKTGTITKGEMTVRKIFTNDNFTEVTGAGYESSGVFLQGSKEINPLDDFTLSLLLKSSVLCNDAIIQRTGEDNFYNVIGTPTEAALLILSAKAGIHREDINYLRKEEIPFSSERKFMSVLCSLGKDNFVFAKGAPEYVIEKCTHIQRSSVSKLTEKDKEKILSVNDSLTSKAYRTLAIAYKKTSSSEKKDLESELIFLGLIGMEDPPRADVKIAIDLCRTAGIKVKMITGDNKETALAIAKEVGLIGKFIEGKDLDSITDEELSKVVNDITIFARVRPEHKLRIVHALKKNGEIVTMTGDGVNDAPALKEAHIGVAMGKNGTDVSRAVADLILKDDNFATIVDAIKEGRTIYNNIKKFSAYQISINVAQTTIILFAILLAFPIPLLAMQILFMNLLTDEIIAITLSFNPPSFDSMRVKPRKEKSLVNKRLLIMLLIAGFTICLSSLAVFYYSLNFLALTEQTARTLVFLTMALFGITNAYNFRSFRYPSYRLPIWSNKYLLYASLIVIALIIAAFFTPLKNILELSSLSFNYWLISILISLSIVVIFDILKTINNKKKIWLEYVI